jgi:hypothetical protein
MKTQSLENGVGQKVKRKHVPFALSSLSWFEEDVQAPDAACFNLSFGTTAWFSLLFAHFG